MPLTKDRTHLDLHHIPEVDHQGVGTEVHTVLRLGQRLCNVLGCPDLTQLEVARIFLHGSANVRMRVKGQSEFNQLLLPPQPMSLHAFVFRDAKRGRRVEEGKRVGKRIF